MNKPITVYIYSGFDDNAQDTEYRFDNLSEAMDFIEAIIGYNADRQLTIQIEKEAV